jgi:hypothetical protein
MLAARQGFPGRLGVRRKPEAKRWRDEQEAIEAARRGEQAKKCEAQYVYGTRCRISDAHKRDRGCAIPGEICTGAVVLRGPRGSRRPVQKSAEAIVRSDPEGPNNDAESRTDDLEAKRGSRKRDRDATCRPEVEHEARRRGALRGDIRANEIGGPPDGAGGRTQQLVVGVPTSG